MDRMLVVVFNDEGKAYEGKKALQQLVNEGSIGAYAYAVLIKNADGTASVKQEDDSGPIGTLVGTSFGSLIGLLGGPAGMLIGAAAGMSAGAAADLTNAGVGADFLDDVAKALTPNKAAVVAEIEEEWTTPVDTRMEALGGIVFRRSVAEVQDKIDEENVAAMKADYAQLKAEHVKAQADRQASFTDKMNALDSKIQIYLEKIKARREADKIKMQVKAGVKRVEADVSRAKAS
jgi:uncharacterized membrane protein